MTHEGHSVDTDPTRLDLDRVHRWLSTDAYWALGRTRDVVERAIAGSLNFGLYDPTGVQVGFARAVTDRATFAWLCDVYVERGSRGTGLGTWFVGEVCAQLRGMGLKRSEREQKERIDAAAAALILAAWLRQRPRGPNG